MAAMVDRAVALQPDVGLGQPLHLSLYGNGEGSLTLSWLGQNSVV